MFEKIVLRRSHAGPALTLGEIAEALLFYQNVHIIMDYGAINALIDSLGMAGLLDLLGRRNVTAVYTEEALATFTKTVGNRRLHGFTAFLVSGDQQSQWPTKQRRLEQLLRRKGHTWKQARKLAERFLERVPVRKFGGDYFVAGGIPKAAAADLLQPNYVEQAIRKIALGTPGLEADADSMRFEIVPATAGFEVSTNINFDAVNARRRMLSPSLEPLTEGYLTSAFLDASGDALLAAHYGGEFYTSVVTSDVVRIRYAELLKRAGISAAELTALKDVALPDYPTIQESINAQVRTFDDFLLLLDKSERFREWIHGLNPDVKLAHEYVREITAQGWMASLPVKLIRYVLASAVGIVWPVAGLAVGAGDSLLLERIAKGWRPSHFVEGKLRPFLGDKQ